MKLAQRMSRIASESAFEVLVRARALEAAGRDVVEFVEERDGVAWWRKRRPSAIDSARE